MEKITKINQVPLKIFLLISLTDLIDTSAQILMKKGLGHSDVNSILAFFFYFFFGLFNFSNPAVWLFWIGLCLYISNFFLWMYVLSKTDLSIALPLASISYILIPLAAVVLLHETVPPLRWTGLGLIVLGIYFVSRSRPSRGGYV